MTKLTVTEHLELAEGSLRQSKKHLAGGDLHQASKNGWEAATYAVRAVVGACGNVEGFRYLNQRDFSPAMEQIALVWGNDRLLLLAGRAEVLYANRRRRIPLRQEVIEKDLVRMTELVGILGSIARDSARFWRV